MSLITKIIEIDGNIYNDDIVRNKRNDYVSHDKTGMKAMKIKNQVSDSGCGREIMKRNNKEKQGRKIIKI
jgi:hypothetical protein